MGVIYSKKGFNAGNVSFLDEYGKAFYVTENYLIVVNYIEVPILTRYNFLNYEYLQLYGQFGFSPNFYLKSNYIYTDKNGEINYSTEKDKGIRPINMGVVGAFGILFPVGDEWKLGVEAPLNAQILPSLRKRPYSKQWYYFYGLNIVVNRSF